MATTRELLLRVRSRLVAVGAIEDLQRGAAFGAGAAVAVLAVARFAAPTLHPAWSLVSGAAVAATFPLAGMFARRRDERSLAAVADERLGLRERISTALWTRGADAGPLGALVVEDADAVAARVPSAAVAKAIRPRLLRRPMTIAGVLALCAAGLALWPAAAQAVESPAAAAARLAQADRIAQVARRIEEQAKRTAKEADQHGLDELAKLAALVGESAREMQREPPPLEQALRRMNDLAEDARAEMRRRAGTPKAADAKEAAARDRALDELMRALSEAGLESLSRDIAEMEKRLHSEKAAGADAASAAETSARLRELAERVDAARKALEQSREAGAAEIEAHLRTIGNEDLLDKIAEKMREMAQNLDDRGYESLESEDIEGADDLSEMSREELEELLETLEAMEEAGELAEGLEEGAGEAAGGRRMRIRTKSGARGASGGKGAGRSGRQGGGNGSGNSGGGSGQGESGDGSASGASGGGQGSGARPRGGDAEHAPDAKSARSPVDPKGRIQVSTFRGLPRPGQLTPEVREAIRAAREDAQAPLESEEIPRRYRDGIRAWFDDLGEEK